MIKNKFEINGNTVTIFLTQNQKTIIDLSDWDRVQGFRWYAHKFKNRFYAESSIKQNNGKWKAYLLHRFLSNVINPKTDTDHKNHQTLDNRNSNLRIATRSQNCMNSKKRKNCKSDYKGVNPRKNNKYQAQINFNKKRIYLGTFDTELEAAKAYDKAAIEHFKEWKYLNLP